MASHGNLDRLQVKKEKDFTHLDKLFENLRVLLEII